MNTENNTQVPHAAGPVWVKASAFEFSDRQYYHAEYKDVSQLSGPYTWMGTGNLRHGAFWWSNAGHPPISEKNLDKLLVLDESNTQQVFTREQVSEAFFAGLNSGLDSAHDRPFITQDEYMHTNYPTK